MTHARPVMDSNICAKFHLHIFPGLWDTLVENEQQEFKKKLSWINQSPIYAI